MSRRIIVTGCAGFIGSHLADACLRLGWQVLGIDNLNAYYSVQLKEDRLKRLIEFPDLFQFIREDIVNREAIQEQITCFEADTIVHLAAQPGIRYSLIAPDEYIHNNILGTFSVFELAKQCGIPHVLYASSSAVYGASSTVPFTVSQAVDKPLNLYAATKAACELMAHSYSSLYGFCSTGLRFFTVYGPWGRPDMAIYQFTRALYENTPITLYNDGDMWRDFTYVDDIIHSIVRLIQQPFQPVANIYNIGNHKPVCIKRIVDILESLTGKMASVLHAPFQPGEMHRTYADVSALQAAVGFSPDTSIDDGLEHFVRWYRDYHQC